MADSKLQPLLDAAAKATPDIVGCLACPFCGQYPTRYEIPAHSHPHIPWMPDFKGCYVVECGACDYHFLRDTEAEVVAAWNTRAPSSLELRLREYVGSLKKYGSNFTPMELSSPGVEARMSFAAAQVKQLEEILENKP